MPTEDQNKLKIRQLEKILGSKIRSEVIACDDGESVSLSYEDERKLITAGNDINVLIEVLKEIMDNKSISFVSERHGLESDMTQKAIDFMTEIAKEHISNFDQHIGKYKQAATALWEADNLTPEILVDKTIEYLSKNK